MKKTIKIFSLFLLLLAGSLQSFAQDDAATMQMSLLRWQANSPVQIVGAGFGKEAVIDEVFLYNSSSSVVSKVQIGGLVFTPEKHLSKNANDFLVLESEPIEVSIPPLQVVHLKKTALWNRSDITRFVKTSKSNDLIVRLGISTSVSENDAIFSSSLKQQRSFERTITGETEYNRISESWQKYGYKHLLELVEQSVKIVPAKVTKNCSLNSLSQNCSPNKFDYDTSWCQRVTQETCRTLQCEGTGFCPKDSCREIVLVE